MEWTFEKGIVNTSNNKQGTFVQRTYYVRYKSNTNLRRVIGAAFVYSRLSLENKQLFLEALVTKDNNLLKDSLKKTDNFIPSMSNVITILDFDIKETDQLPAPMETLLTNYDYMNNDSQEDTNPLTLKHFETHLVNCKINKCICTITDDSECKRRIDELIENRSLTMQPSQEEVFNVSIKDPVAYIRRIVELESFVLSQQEEIKRLQTDIETLKLTQQPQ